jgi:hypothetical protein
MKCDACGNTNVKKKIYKEIIRAPYGSEEFYYSASIFCNDCKASIDATEDGPVIQAIQRSERNGLINMIKDLYKKGIKTDELERTFRLPFGTIERNMQSQDPVDSSLLALIILVMNNIKILDHEQMFHCRVTHSQEVQ